MYLTIVCTPFDPEDESSGYLFVGHSRLPFVSESKGGRAANEKLKRQAYEKYVGDMLIHGRSIHAAYTEPIIDWLMRASVGDNLLLPPHNGRDGVFLVLVGDRGAPSNYAVRAEPSFVLINEDDEAEREEDPGENRTFLDDEEDEEPQPRKAKKRR